MGPFAIIIALLNAEGRILALVFVLIGIYLVNRPAHHMSKAIKRSRQQARELAQLESLAQQLIEAPADASTLPGVLAEALPGERRSFGDALMVKIMVGAVEQAGGSRPASCQPPSPRWRIGRSRPF